MIRLTILHISSLPSSVPTLTDPSALSGPKFPNVPGATICIDCGPFATQLID